MVHASKKLIIVAVVVCLAVSIFVAGWTANLFAAKPSPNPDTSGLTAIVWDSQPEANSANAALLSGAYALMQGIYTYTAGAPEYLPSSYQNPNNALTNYVVHAAYPSNVSWAPSEDTQLIWQSVPGGLPKGWSGNIIAAGPTATEGNPEPLHVMTDCSGFITSLFTYANTVHPTKFDGWQSGSSIPEAGCNNPAGAQNEPNPLNYYKFFVTGQNGWFQNVSIADLQPGDIIAYANTANSKDSGHIMLVAAVSNGADNTQSRYVVVIDETGSPHSNDTRNITVLPSGEKEGAGVGMGIIKLTVSSDNQLQFYWGMNSTEPEVGAIALGRAL